MTEITVQTIKVPLQVNEKAIQDYVQAVIRRMDLPVDTVTIVLVDNEYLRQLHAQYLGDDSYTDIMTFPLHEPGEPISADMVISVDMAKDNAQFYNVSLEEELRRLIIHGLLHLGGMGDASDEERRRMREKENELLQDVPFGNPFLNKYPGK